MMLTVLEVLLVLLGINFIVLVGTAIWCLMGANDLGRALDAYIAALERYESD